MEVQHHAFDGDLDSGVLVGYALHVLRRLARAHELALLDVGDAALCDSCDEVAGERRHIGVLSAIAHLVDYSAECAVEACAWVFPDYSCHIDGYGRKWLMMVMWCAFASSMV